MKSVWSGSRIVKRLRCRKYNRVITGKTICLVLDPSTTLYRSFLTHFALWQTRRWGLYDRTCPNVLREDNALILVPSDCKSGLFQPLDLSWLPDGRRVAFSGRCLYICLIYCIYHLRCLCNDFITSLLWLVLSSVLLRKSIYKILNVCPFDNTAFAISEKVFNTVNQFNHTSWVAVVLSQSGIVV